MDPRLGRFVSVDPPMVTGAYFPVPPVDDKAKEKNKKLPGMGGVFNPVNLNVYQYAGNNPVVLIDHDGNSVAAVAAQDLKQFSTQFGPYGKWLMIGVAVLCAADFVYEAAKEAKGKKAEEPTVVGDNDALPQQGNVTAGVDDAPPVSAGSQGKHVRDHKNDDDPGRSKWDEGENGVRQTQEAWKNGRVVKQNGPETVKIGRSSDGRTVKVHQRKDGTIHGYPL